MVHTRKALDRVCSALEIGPWRPVPGTDELATCECPSAWQLPNGTFYMVCQGRPAATSFLRADALGGPWTPVAPLLHAGGPAGKYEDPFVYTTARGWHVLWHVYNYTEHPPHGHECRDSTVSAHSFSTDGITWHTGRTQPYGTTARRADGVTAQFATRERPKLRFDEQGRMTHLLNGVCGVENCPAGPPTGCVDCKYANWDFTLVAPLDA